MNQRRSIHLALYSIAGLLALNLVAILARHDAPIFPSAFAADTRQPPIAGGGGLFVMPAQLSSNTWGAYLMDIDRGTLCVYQYFPGTKQLQFIASRKFTNDTRLENFNTTPTPSEIVDLVDKQNKPLRGAAEDAAPGIK